MEEPSWASPKVMAATWRVVAGEALGPMLAWGWGEGGAALALRERRERRLLEGPPAPPAPPPPARTTVGCLLPQGDMLLPEAS